MRRILLLGATIAALAATTSAPAHAAQQPLYWTIPLGGLLPVDPPIPLIHQRCTPTYCIGTLGTIQGHNYKWLLGRDPVWRLRFTRS